MECSLRRKGYVQNFIKETSLYRYYLLHPENEFLENLMNTHMFAYSENGPYLSEYKTQAAFHFCYREILQNNFLSIIDDTILDMCAFEQQNLCYIAIEQNHKEVITLLHEHKFLYNVCIRDFNYTSWYINILEFAYEKHGAELIKHMSDIGVTLTTTLLSKIIRKDNDLFNYLIENHCSGAQIDEIFLCCVSLGECDKIPCYRETLVMFTNRINLNFHQDEIFKRIARQPIFVAKILIEQGLVTNSNALLYACTKHNLELIEFYLQCGLQVNSNILNKILTPAGAKPCLRLPAGAGLTFKHFNKSTLRLFIKYNVDFSLFTRDNVDVALFNELEDNGLDKNVLLSALLQ